MSSGCDSIAANRTRRDNRWETIEHCNKNI